MMLRNRVYALTNRLNGRIPRRMASIDAKIDEFYKNFDTKVDKEKFNLLLVTEYVDQGLNMEQPIPSLMLDHILTLIKVKDVYQSIGYFLNRFRRSIFGFKTRPWTIFLFAKKGLELGADEILVQYVEAADQSGLFLDSLCVKFVIEGLLKKEKGDLAARIAVTAALQDMVDDECVASLCLKTILENDLSTLSEKNIYAALRNLSSLGHKSIYPYALAGLIKEKESFSKKDFHIFNPHFDTIQKLEKYLSQEDIEALTDLDLILEAMRKSVILKDLNGSNEKFENQIQCWTEYSQKLHNVYGDLINERRNFKTSYFEEEKIRMAGVEYALEQTGLYARKDDLLAQRNKEIITPYFIANDFGLICVSDFELEQTVYERENKNEWDKIDQFFRNRTNEMLNIAEEYKYFQEALPNLTKKQRTNPRWDDNKEFMDEFTKPDRLPKLPVE